MNQRRGRAYCKEELQKGQPLQPFQATSHSRHKPLSPRRQQDQLRKKKAKKRNIKTPKEKDEVGEKIFGRFLKLEFLKLSVNSYGNYIVFFRPDCREQKIKVEGESIM